MVKKVNMKIEEKTHKRLKEVWKDFPNGITLSTVIDSLISNYHNQIEYTDSSTNKERKEQKGCLF